MSQCTLQTTKCVIWNEKQATYIIIKGFRKKNSKYQAEGLPIARILRAYLFAQANPSK